MSSSTLTAQQYIQQLQLQPHPEGGYYKETYRSSLATTIEGFASERNVSTGIYFLLQRGNFSAFHKIKSDEMWHFYAGDPLLVHMLPSDGSYTCVTIGNNINNHQTFQFVVPANTWFASEPAPQAAFSLVGCTVAPGFDFADFEMAKAKDLVQQFPAQEALIKRLCRQ